MSQFHDLDEDADDAQAHNSHLDISNCCDESGINRKDFFFGRTLGEGSYARVVHAKRKTDATLSYAVKIMDKAFIRKENKIKFVIREKEILSVCSHPYIIKLAYSFQDQNYLYLCLEMALGGDLQAYINNHMKQNEAKGLISIACSVDTARFYLAELIIALEYLHSLDILHLDVKPENILLTRSGHIKLADFGTAMRDVKPEDLGNMDIFVGTAQYVSPEILNEDNEHINKSCDLWAAGCCLHQLLCGSTPFKAETEYLIFVAINGHVDGTQPLEYPPCICTSLDAVDVISGLLRGDPAQRYGAGEAGSSNSYTALKSHPFFSGMDFPNLLSVRPPEWDAYKHTFLSIPPLHPPPAAAEAVSLSTSTAREAAESLTDGSVPGEVMHDGALDDWLFEGDATPIVKDKRPSLITVQQSTRKVSTTSTGSSKYAKYLSGDENEVLSGPVFKRVGLFSKKRILILTDAPRLIYIDPDTQEQKGEIPWTVDHPVTAKASSHTHFDAVCGLTGRAYHFSVTAHDSHSALIWAECVNDVLKRRIGDA